MFEKVDPGQVGNLVAEYRNVVFAGQLVIEEFYRGAVLLQQLGGAAPGFAPVSNMLFVDVFGLLCDKANSQFLYGSGVFGKEGLEYSHGFEQGPMH